MNRIRLLSEQVANQIAAGEVVERPASVVKELVENSLDAGATSIVVEILAAGRGLIRVRDDGSGMSRDDALLCLERHATSKITSARDLSHIATLGFRGEAIPSIASVSRFSLTTREQAPSEDATPATQIIINGGKIIEVRETGSAPGTTIDIRSLFFNVPARRKFLRSDETERAHIQHWLTKMALAHPQVAFTLIMEGRTVWQLPALPVADSADGSLRALHERLRWLLGDGFALVSVEARDELGAARIAPANIAGPSEISPPTEAHLWGWIGAPGISRASREDQHFFVNCRPVENRGLNAAVIEGYHNALMKGRYPLGCLFLEIDPAEVDVNIHPAKREVKFHRERAVRQFVAEALRQALKDWGNEANRVASQPTVGAIPQTSAGQSADQYPLAAPPPQAVSPNPVPPVPLPAPASRATVSEDGPMLPGADFQSGFPIPPPARPSSDISQWAQGLAAPRPISSPGQQSSPASSGLSGATPMGAITSNAPGSVPVVSSHASPVPLLTIPLRVVGVIGRLYVVLESDRGLVLLDQHAAHERVLYEQALRRLQQGAAMASQRMLLPETIELAPKDAAFLRENLPALARLGVGLSEFGERTFLLDALPPFVKSASPRRFALELIDELRAAGDSVNVWRLGEAVVAKTVCRHAVKANDLLAGPELESLIADLRNCEMPYTCPHGRPTLIEMNFRELEKKFGRIAG